MRHIKLALFVVLALLATSQTASANAFTLAWDPSPGTDVAGYRVFYGTQPGVYTDSVDVGLRTNWHLIVPGSQRFYVAVRAYSASRTPECGVERSQRRTVGRSIHVRLLW